MKIKSFSKKDKLFIALFSIAWIAVSYATYKVIGIKSGEETFSIVQIIKTTVGEFIG